MKRRWFAVTGVLALAVAAANSAHAQAPYPNRPVRLISDSSPGSAVDTGLRIIADGMSRALETASGGREPARRRRRHLGERRRPGGA